MRSNATMATVDQAHLEFMEELRIALRDSEIAAEIWRAERNAARAELIVWPVRLQDALLRAQETFEVFRADAESERDALREQVTRLRLHLGILLDYTDEQSYSNVPRREVDDAQAAWDETRPTNA